jgi:hypothetical protein
MEDRSGYIYVLRAQKPHEECYKIGRTNNPKRRLHDFAVKLPFRVESVITSRVFDMIAEEAELHKKFAGKRIDGEWFQLTSSDVALLRVYYLTLEADDLFYRLVSCLRIITDRTAQEEPHYAECAERYSRLTAMAARRMKRRLTTYKALLSEWTQPPPPPAT